MYVYKGRCPLEGMQHFFMIAKDAPCCKQLLFGGASPLGWLGVPFRRTWYSRAGDHGFFGKTSPMEVSLRIPMLISGPAMRAAASGWLWKSVDVWGAGVVNGGLFFPPIFFPQPLKAVGR